MWILRMASKVSETRYGVVSAFVEGADDNRDRHAALREDIAALGYEPVEVTGEWEGVPELCWFVPGIGSGEIIELGEKYGQDAVVWCGDGSQPTLVMVIG